jgi:hypothetical protein
VIRRDRRSALRRGVDDVRGLSEWVRGELYGVREGAWRTRATTAVAAASAEEAYRLSDHLPELWNETSANWKGHLDNVWAFLAGDAGQHYQLSRAIAEFLTSPLNHNDGQYGPDDFDRPWTVASYSAVASAVMWGVDFAITSTNQVFECIDLSYGDKFPAERLSQVTQQVRSARERMSTVVAAFGPGQRGLTAEVLATIR